MEVTLLPIVTLVRDVQKEKDLSPIVVTLSGMIISSSDEQS